jgi:hypothetical protein
MKLPDDDDEIEWVNFDAEEPSVLTGDLCAFFGGCAKCPGFTTAGTVNQGHPDPDAPVFCIHWCHREPPRA